MIRHQGPPAPVPFLADKLALNTEGRTAVDVAISLLREIRPDVYEKHPRAELAKLADGSALRGLQEELSRAPPHPRSALG